MGIGQHLAYGLAEHGANVVVADIATERAQAVAGDIEQLGSAAIAVTTDVCQPDDIRRLYETAIQRFGAVDILVNNAGGGSRDKYTRQESPFGSLESWHHTMALTLTSAFLCCQQFAPAMIERKQGKIINIASVYGIVGLDPSLYELDPDGNPRQTIPYAAAKGGVVTMTRAMAVHLAPHDICVNAIAPGMVRTERLATGIGADTWQKLSGRTPLGRPAMPEDMKGAVVYFASPSSDFVTGQILAVDGGWLAW